MQFFFEVLIGGLLAGVMYSLVALGFVLIYKASGVFNFAQGAMVFFAALTTVGFISMGAPFSLAVGIALRRIWVIVWTVAGFVALVTGLLWGARNGVQFALTFLALKALPVLILGGFESIAGAIVGGLIVGASEKLAEVYIGPQ